MNSKFSEEEQLPSNLRIRRANSDRQRKKDMHHPERHITKESNAGSNAHLILATVLRTAGAYFIARKENGDEIQVRTIKNTLSGNTNASLVAVGDAVMVEESESGTSVIREVLARRTKLSRRAHKRRDSFEQVIAANIDLIGIVSSASEPPFRPGLIDKYIVAALEGGLDVLIILNKSDLLATDERKEFISECLEYYQVIGYPSIQISATNGDSIEELRHTIEEKTIVFAGKSGVGKSSLVNALTGEATARTQGLMRKGSRGMHTTTNASIIPLPTGNSYIVDTPGIKEFFNFDLEPNQIRFHFVEFAGFATNCSMTNCLHIHEPGCAVTEAVDDELIPEWRHNSYVTMWEEAERERKARIGGM